MSGRTSLRTSINPLKEMHNRVIRRFKTIVRLVLANLAWLEDVQEEEMQLAAEENFQKRLYMLTRKKAISIVPVKCKVMLRKPLKDRTDEDRQAIFKQIGNLRCFRKYPENVRLGLTGNCLFRYYGPNRTIVRQNHKASALYFLVSGEAKVYVNMYDQQRKEWAVTFLKDLTMGDYFGEIELMKNLPRLHTVISSTPVEFVVLEQSEFNLTLKTTVRQLWDDVLKAMARFSYFDKVSDALKLEVCILARIRDYKFDETIVGDGKGLSHWSHFILDGECTLIELITINDPEEKIKSKSKLKSIVSRKSTMARTSENPRKSDKSDSSRSTKGENISKIIAYRTMREKEDEPHEEEDEIIRAVRMKEKEYEDMIDGDKLPPNVEPVFVQICHFRELGCFCIGEPMRNRRVIAKSQYVTCLLIPRYWLNANLNMAIFGKVVHFLQLNIPNTQQVREDVIRQRRWRNYKKNLIKGLQKRTICNSIHNVPYFYRIRQDYDMKEVGSYI